MKRQVLGHVQLQNCISTESSNRAPKSNRVLPIDRRTGPRKETLESILSSVLRAEDKELDHILHVLEDLSKVVNSTHCDSVAVNDALTKAAVWAVEQSLLDREIKSLAITDELTGLFNRRGFQASAAQQLKLAHRDQQNILLLFCDLDSLKQINDLFGHQEGDLAIIRTADALEQTFRDSDILARLGGDEFTVLAWEASIPNLQTILSRLEKNLEIAHADEPRYELSLSVGVAKFDPRFPLPLGELMAIADKDMYKHKRGAHSTSQRPKTKCIVPAWFTSWRAT